MSVLADATASATPHDKAAAAAFLAALAPTARQFTFQLFSDDDRGYAEIVHGTLEEVWPKVLSLNTTERGVGVFVTINETDLRGRRVENIIRPRALFADADGPDQIQQTRDTSCEAGATPTMVVLTSPGRAHFYWCCDDVPREQFSELQGALIGKLGTDPAVKDLPRVMRLPGTLHLKDPKAPSKVTLLISGQRWKLPDLSAQLALSLAPSSNRAKPDFGSLPPADRGRLARMFGADYFSALHDLYAGIETNIEEIRSAAAALRPTTIAAEPDWVKFARGMAHEAAVYSAQAEELWLVLDTTSTAAPGYNQVENRRRWERYIDEAFNHRAPLTIATVFSMARKDGWTGWSPLAGNPGVNSFTSAGNLNAGAGTPVPLSSGLRVSFSGISHRAWLYGIDLVVGEITVLASPGGVGKSSLAIGMCAAVATGKRLLDEQIYGKNLSALYINAEDSRIEMQRRVWAFSLQHGLAEQDLDRFLLLGADDWQTQRISFLRTDRGASVVDGDGIAFLDTLLADSRPDVVVIDPLVAFCGGGNLNDNAVMSLVMRGLKRLANKFKCAILVLHHTRKGGDLSSAEAIGGASAIVNLARRAIMAVPMSSEEAPKLGVLASERFGHFKVVGAKSNLARASDKAPWYKLSSVTLPNAEAPIYPHGDKVQAVIRVQLPCINQLSIADDLAIRRAILDTIARGKMVDGERVSYSPKTSGADNKRSLMDDAITAVAAATKSRQWAPGDVEAAVKQTTDTMMTDGWLVEYEITKGRFRRGRGLRVNWTKTPWPNAGTNTGSTASNAVVPNVAAPEEAQQVIADEARGHWSIKRSMSDQSPKQGGGGQSLPLRGSIDCPPATSTTNANIGERGACAADAAGETAVPDQAIAPETASTPPPNAPVDDLNIPDF